MADAATYFGLAGELREVTEEDTAGEVSGRDGAGDAVDGVGVVDRAVLSETTILNFRHLLEKHDLCGAMLEAVNHCKREHTASADDFRLRIAEPIQPRCSHSGETRDRRGRQPGGVKPSMSLIFLC
jgi:hypothetical protein